MILERNGMQASAAPRFVELAAEGCTPNVDRLRSFLETRFRVESEVVVPWWERAPPPATPISLSAVDPKVTSAVQQRAMNQAFAVMKAAGISAQARGAGPNVLRIDAIVWAQSAQYQFNRNSGAITIFAGASAHLAVSARDAEGCVYATQVTHEIPPPKGAQLGQAPPLEAAVAGAVTDGVNQMLNYR
jgi:hypothetical protein